MGVRANLKSRVNLPQMLPGRDSIVWELTKETICLPLDCLQDGEEKGNKKSVNGAPRMVQAKRGKKCAAVPRRARISGSQTFVPLNSRLESSKEEVLSHLGAAARVSGRKHPSAAHG